MSKLNLPEIQANNLPKIYSFVPKIEMVDHWNPSIRAKQTPENTITILDQIGEDWYTGGVTAKRVSAALRAIGDEDVFVDINSPGGDYFEGIAIYNMLLNHPSKVTVRVLGLAASAASVIAMAGDEIAIGKAGFIMIHNAWVVALGNRHDLIDAAKTLKPFDDAMASVYASRAKISKSTAAKWMDDESWFSGDEAIKNGLATGYLDADIVEDEGSKQAKAQKSIVKAEIGLRVIGNSRCQARDVLGDIIGAQAVAEPNRQAVADETLAALKQLSATLKP